MGKRQGRVESRKTTRVGMAFKGTRKRMGEEEDSGGGRERGTQSYHVYSDVSSMIINEPYFQISEGSIVATDNRVMEVGVVVVVE